VSRRSVGTHQGLATDDQAGMRDFVVSFGCHLIADWRISVGLHHHDFAAKHLLIELERFFALAVGIQKNSISWCTPWAC
jgi:hypothetical protein